MRKIRKSHKPIFTIILGLVMVLASMMPVIATAQPNFTTSEVNGENYSDSSSNAVDSTLQKYGADTWKSYLAMTYSNTGLPADNINAVTAERSKYTSPTNIGAYIWSTLVARDIQVINPKEARDRIAVTLATLSRMERGQGTYIGADIVTGNPVARRYSFFYNWYDPSTGDLLTKWPASGDPLDPFLSSVDNGWLAAALIMVSNSIPQLHDQAEALLKEMDFGFFYDDGYNGKPNIGLLKGGYWPSMRDCQGYTCFDYGTLNTEPRIASYIGIARGQIPPTHYFKMWRTFPDTCDWSWQEMKPIGVTRNYLGVNVFEGHYTYAGMDIVPTWGGSMFEALMVPLFVPEAQWGPRSWGINHPLYVQAQIFHGLNEEKYGYWGFSPSNDPAGGYREYGVDAIGLNPDGYTSDEERQTTVDYGFSPCRPATKLTPSTNVHGVVTPHASFLALQFNSEAALKNLANLRRDFDAYGWGGFYDAINVGNKSAGVIGGAVAKYYLALDQGMIMMAIGNELRNNRPQSYFSQGLVEKNIHPLLNMEEFTAGPKPD
jgi:hypothetical protein